MRLPALSGVVLLPALLLVPLPACAMCGGNVFATCPPRAPAADKATAKREKKRDVARPARRRP